jgi:hypothetical protein
LPVARQTIQSTIGRRSFDPANRAHADEIADASVTIFDLFTMAHCVVEGTVEEARIDKYRQALSGNPRGNGKKHCAARDTQFEMVLGSWITLAGRAVSLGEPDLLARFETGEYGIAAKRIESRKKIRENTKKAIKQIEKAGKPGIVALNLDQVVRDPVVASHLTNPDGGILDALPELHVGESEFRHPDVLARNCVARKFRWIESGETPGLAVLGHLLVEPWVDASVPERRVSDDLNKLMLEIIEVATSI